MRGRNECQETDDTPLPPQEKLDPSAIGARAKAGAPRQVGCV